ncbi:MAG: chemoreceptor glutamine deamidase CheD [Gammaproteobacteria bacterium]|nr:chemoreceptor glutamine deamidase CheD [Gammaproteobacteria bacterium]
MSNGSLKVSLSNEPGDGPRPALAGFKQINRYWDRSHQCYAAKLLPGDYYITTHDEIIVTILGSCISACIRDSIFGIGGMNHFMLPRKSLLADNWRNTRLSLANRYGSYAMENLINDILKNGGERKNLEVKIFGGGRILAHMTDIGRNNIDFIKQYIVTEELNLLAEDVGGTHPRKIVYFPLTGKVRVKKLRSLHNQTIIERESRYLQDIQSHPVSGDIELF